MGERQYMRNSSQILTRPGYGAKRKCSRKLHIEPTENQSRYQYQ